MKNMKHDNFYESDIFNNYANILEGQGQLTKKAEYLLPESQVIGSNDSDLIEMTLSKLASDGRSGVYDLSLDESNEAMAARAHPGGGVMVEKAADELGKVETIFEDKRKHEDMATRESTGKLAALAERLSKLANNFDRAGLEAMAINMDSLLEKIAHGPMAPAGKPAPVTPPAFEPSLPQEPMTAGDISKEHAEEMRKKFPGQVKPQAADGPMGPAGKPGPVAPELPAHMQPKPAPDSPPTSGDLAAEHAELMRKKYPDQVKQF